MKSKFPSPDTIDKLFYESETTEVVRKISELKGIVKILHFRYPVSNDGNFGKVTDRVPFALPPELGSEESRFKWLLESLRGHDLQDESLKVIFSKRTVQLPYHNPEHELSPFGKYLTTTYYSLLDVMGRKAASFLTFNKTITPDLETANMYPYTARIYVWRKP